MLDKIKQFVIRDYALEIWLFLGGIFALNVSLLGKVFGLATDFHIAGQFGSFVGGYVGPLFALLGVLLLVRTLKAQQQSSRQQNFETKYFELLKIHRDNVSEIGIDGSPGRRFFVLVIREFRCALDIVRNLAKRHHQRLNNGDLLHIAYYCVFYGVGPNSSRMLISSLCNFDERFVHAIERELNDESTKVRIAEERRFRYKPFEGHQSRLGHYYRHLYQLVRYVDENAPLVKFDAYEFAKTVRAQLSTHEQALLLINSLTPVGRNWWDKEFIKKYRLVQNIPPGFFNDATEINTEDLFGANYFEWQETQS